MNIQEDAEVERLTAEREQARRDATDARVAEHHWSDACHEMHMKYGEQLAEVERLTAELADIGEHLNSTVQDLHDTDHKLVDTESELMASQAEVERLTAELAAVQDCGRCDGLQDELTEMKDELAAEKIHAVEATAVIIEAQAREEALRAITGQMLDLHSDGIVTWVRVCNEWDRRAGEVT